MSTRSILARSLAAALVVGTACSLAVPPARAWDRPGNLAWAEGRLVDVQVRVDGRAAPLYLSPQGDSRRYVQAFAGRNYSLVLRNNSAGRIGVHIAVDGLNVVSGQRSSGQRGEAMYVLDPYETATIDGWRTSLDDIQRFVFVDEARSYASRTGQANGDMGWIRVTAYRELQSCLPLGSLHWNEPRRDDKVGGGPQAAPPAREERDGPLAAAPAPAAGQVQEDRAQEAPMAKARGNATLQGGALADGRESGSYPGTGWGEHRNDHVEQVQFTAEFSATDKLVFRYEYASGLHALGIDLDRDRLRDRDNGQLGFARPPRW